ncbi:MAG: NADPH:quinone oxidoreductase family protein [Gammaproteobacteria bacterium]
MRAVVVREFGPIERHRVEDIPMPKPGAGEVRIAVQAAGVNFPDILVVTGDYQVRPPLPFVPGKELAGVVAELGTGVRDLRIGDRVVAYIENGAFAEHAIAPASHCHPIPAAMTFEHAATGLVYQTAYYALHDRGQFQPGERVLITGASGGVGLAAIELVKALGGVALAGARGSAKQEAARAHGADHIVDLSVSNLRDAVRDQVRAATGGHGADIVVEMVGGEVFDASLRALAWRGRLVVVGFAGGAIPNVKANYLLLKNIAVSGLHWSDYRERDPAGVRQVQNEINQFYLQGKLKPHVMQTLALADCAAAMRILRDGRVIGKVVLTTA